MDEPRFLINGTEYPVPSRASLTLDEHVIFHEWTGMHLEEIDDTPVNALMIGAFMQIAYLRANVDTPPHVARRLVGGSNFEEALSAMAASEEEADPSPPEQGQSVNEPPALPESRSSSPPTSGTDSTTPSATPANGQPDSGQPASATLPTLAPETWVA